MGMLGHYKMEILGKSMRSKVVFFDFFENEIPAWQYTEKNGLFEISCGIVTSMIFQYRSGNPNQRSM
jgi:hypothetical protein